MVSSAIKAGLRRSLQTASDDARAMVPPKEGELWSCWHAPGKGIRQSLSPDEIRAAAESGKGTLWVDVDSRDPEEVAILSDVFEFHPLAIEDALNPEQRAKLEEYDDYILVVVRTIAFREETEDPYDLDTVNITFFLGKNYVVTVHGSETTPVAATAAMLKRKPELVEFGPSRLMHAIVDESVNAYFPIIDRLDDFMDGLEERIFEQFDQSALQDVFNVKRLVLSLRRHLAPQRDVFNILTNRPSTLLTPETQIYFRDIYDHVLRINDSLENFRELLSNTLDAYLTQVSNRLGQVTKALSVVATVTLPFIVISGMWGMNFTQIPLSHHANGFWIMLVVQLALGFIILLALRWRKLL